MELYNPLYQAAKAARTFQPAPELDELPPMPGVDEEEEPKQPGLIKQVANAGLSTVAAAGNLLDLPGSMARDVVTWLPGGTKAKNPFDQLLDPLGRNAQENRVEGRQILRDYGLVGKKDTWGNFAAGMVGEMFMDPTSYLGVGVVGKVGNAFKKAGLMGKTKAMVKEAAEMAGKDGATIKGGAGWKYAMTGGRVLDHMRKLRDRAAKSVGEELEGKMIKAGDNGVVDSVEQLEKYKGAGDKDWAIVDEGGQYKVYEHHLAEDATKGEWKLAEKATEDLKQQLAGTSTGTRTVNHSKAVTKEIYEKTYGKGFEEEMLNQPLHSFVSFKIPFAPEATRKALLESPSPNAWFNRRMGAMSGGAGRGAEDIAEAAQAGNKADDGKTAAPVASEAAAENATAAAEQTAGAAVDVEQSIAQEEAQAAGGIQEQKSDNVSPGAAGTQNTPPAVQPTRSPVRQQALDALKPADGTERSRVLTQFADSLGEEHVGASLPIIDAMVENIAKLNGKDPEEYWKTLAVKATKDEDSLADIIREAEEGGDWSGLFQKKTKGSGNRGVLQSKADGTKHILGLFEGADASTALHEMSHFARKYLPKNLQKLADEGVEELMGAKPYKKDGAWSVAAEETFAKHFESYMTTGKAPTEKLQGVFEKIKEFMLNIYSKLRGQEININPKLKEVFDQILGKEDVAKNLDAGKKVDNAATQAGGALPDVTKQRFASQDAWMSPAQIARRNAAVAKTPISPVETKLKDVKEVVTSLEPLRSGVTKDGVTIKAIPHPQGSLVGDGGGRPMVVMSIDGVAVPFYQSTGDGGKVLQQGAWYPFFGVNESWINKTNAEEMAEYYGSKKIAAAAQLLDDSTGNITHLVTTGKRGEFERGAVSLGTMGLDAKSEKWINQGRKTFDGKTWESNIGLRTNINQILEELGEEGYYKKAADDGRLTTPEKAAKSQPKASPETKTAVEPTPPQKIPTAKEIAKAQAAADKLPPSGKKVKALEEVARLKALAGESAQRVDDVSANTAQVGDNVSPPKSAADQLVSKAKPVEEVAQTNPLQKAAEGGNLSRLNKLESLEEAGNLTNEEADELAALRGKPNEIVDAAKAIPEEDVSYGMGSLARFKPEPYKLDGNLPKPRGAAEEMVEKAGPKFMPGQMELPFDNGNPNVAAAATQGSTDIARQITPGARVEATTRAITADGARNSKPKDMELEIESARTIDEGVVVKFKGKSGSWRGEANDRGGMVFIDQNGKRSIEVYDLSEAPIARAPENPLIKAAKPQPLKAPAAEDVPKLPGEEDLSPEDLLAAEKELAGAEVSPDVADALKTTDLPESKFPENSEFPKQENTPELENGSTAVAPETQSAIDKLVGLAQNMAARGAAPNTNFLLQKASEVLDNAGVTGAAKDNILQKVARLEKTADAPVPKSDNVSPSPQTQPVKQSAELAPEVQRNIDALNAVADQIERVRINSRDSVLVDSEDLTQGAMAKLYSALSDPNSKLSKQLEGMTPEQAQAHLKGAAIRLAKQDGVGSLRKRGRGKKRDAADALGGEDARAKTAGAEQDRAPLEEMAARDLEQTDFLANSAAAKTVLENLSENDAELLRDVHGIDRDALDYEQLAEKLGVKEATVRKRVSVARERAREAVQSLDDIQSKMGQSAEMDRALKTKEQEVLNALKEVAKEKAHGKWSSKLRQGPAESDPFDFDNAYEIHKQDDIIRRVRKGLPQELAAAKEALSQAEEASDKAFEAMIESKTNLPLDMLGDDARWGQHEELSRSTQDAYDAAQAAQAEAFEKYNALHDQLISKDNPVKFLHKHGDKWRIPNTGEGADRLKMFDTEDAAIEAWQSQLRAEHAAKVAEVGEQATRGTDWRPNEMIPEDWSMLSQGPAASETEALKAPIYLEAMRKALEDTNAKQPEWWDDFASVAEKGENLFFNNPVMRRLAALFDKSTYGGITEEEQEVARQYTRANQEAIFDTRQKMVPLVKSIAKTGLLNEDTIMSKLGGPKKELRAQARHILHQRNVDIVRYMENKSAAKALDENLFPDQAVRVQLQDQLDLMGKILGDEIMKDALAGLDTRALKDVSNYFPRMVNAMGRGVSDRGQEVFNTAAGYQQGRRAWTRDIKDGRAVLDDLSIDKNISGIFWKQPVLKKGSAPQVEVDGKLIDVDDYLQQYPPEGMKYSERILTEKHFDEAGNINKAGKKKLRDVGKGIMKLDPEHVARDVPMYGRNFLHDLMQRVETGMAKRGIAGAAQQMVIKGASLDKQQRSIVDLFRDIKMDNPNAYKNVIRGKGMKDQYESFLKDQTDEWTKKLEKGDREIEIDGQTAKVRKDGDQLNIVDVDDEGVEILYPIDGDTISEQLERSMNLPQKFASKVGMTVDEESYQAATRFLKPKSGPDEFKIVKKIAQAMNNLAKVHFTLPFPAFWGRNITSGQMQNYFYGAFDAAIGKSVMQNPAKVIRQGHQISVGKAPSGLYKELPETVREEIQKKIQSAELQHPGLSGEALNDAAAAQWVRENVFQFGLTGDKHGYASEHLGDSAGSVIDQMPGAALKNGPLGIVRKPAADSTVAQWASPWEVSGGGKPVRVPVEPDAAGELVGKANEQKMKWTWERPDQTKFLPVRLGEDMSQYGENLNRVTAFLGYVKQGYTAREASARAMTVHFDYSNLSEFERTLRSIIPFYTFSSRVIPLTFGDILTNPAGKQAMAIRATARASDSNQPTPENIKRSTSIPLGETETGANRYLTGFGLGYEDALSFTPALQGNFQGTASEIVSRLRPEVQALGEVATGRSMFFDKPLNDLDPAIGRLGRNITGSTAEGQAEPFISRGVEFLVGKSPASRYISTANNVFDQRRGVGTKALQVLTGVKVQDVEPWQQERIAIDQGAEALKQLGGKMMETPYLPKWQEERLSESQRADAMAIKKFIQDARKESARKKKEVEALKAAASGPSEY